MCVVTINHTFYQNFPKPLPKLPYLVSLVPESLLVLYHFQYPVFQIKIKNSIKPLKTSHCSIEQHQKHKNYTKNLTYNKQTCITKIRTETAEKNKRKEKLNLGTQKNKKRKTKLISSPLNCVDE